MQHLPSYGRFVFWFSIQAGLGMFLFVFAWVAMIVVIAGGFVPSLAELKAAGTYYLALAAYGVTMFCLIFYQNDRWIALVRQPAQTEARQVPRPLASRNHQETRRLTSQMAMGRNTYFPVFAEHYAALYRQLERNGWKITKRNLKIEVDGVRIFPDIDAKYMGIVKEWNRLGFVDGYVAGEAREKWALSAAGQAKFAELGRVPLPH